MSIRIRHHDGKREQPDRPSRSELAQLCHALRRDGERARATGFTLIELAVVVALITVLALLAAPNLGQMLPQYRLNRTVREFADHVQMARLLAVSQNREYRVCLIDKDGTPASGSIQTSVGRYKIEAGNASSSSSTWDTLPIGSGSEEGDIRMTYSTSNRTYAGVSITGWTALGGPGTGNSNCIVFSPRGWITNPATDFTNAGYIQVYFRNKGANPRNDSRTVLISRGGMSRIRTGDATTVVTGAS